MVVGIGGLFYKHPSVITSDTLNILPDFNELMVAFFSNSLVVLIDLQ